LSVKVPDPKTQWEKTPSHIRVTRHVRDPVSGEEIEIIRWEPWFEEVEPGTVRVVSWKGWRDKILLAADHTYEEMKSNLEKMGGKPKKLSKKGVLAGVIELYKRKIGSDEYDALTTADFEREIKDFAIRQGRWGLGCPHRCGRCWTFKPRNDLTGWIPEDPLAWKGPVTDEGGSILHERGYLNWQPQSDGSVKFKCDRCGRLVELII